MGPALSIVKDIAIIVAGVMALATFASGVIEYVRQGRQRRAENFVQMRRRFLETSAYVQILNLLSRDDPAVAEIPIQERRNFVGFLEEVALMVNSRLIRLEVAHYMFGRYVLLTARSEHLWKGLDPDGIYWRLFWKFARQMEVLEQRAKATRRALKL